MTPQSLLRYRIALAFFIVSLVLSGLTAFPLLTELSFVSKALGINDPSAYASLTGLQHWIAFVHHGLQQTYAAYPFVGYGTDWLAFGHLVIAMFFVGPWRDPVGNAWVLRVGLVACASIIPLAMICGAIRGIPFSWRLIDCSFGVFGSLPLIYCLRVVGDQKVGVE
ncbi:MAG: hypothetical protein JNM99_02935 [Verrucomicrobiaceae bacterium]|nr:hypothetical protein [Verrucomicrobiaceae bacterium]